MEDRSIHEKIDACRPGSDDHRRADLAPVGDRIQNDPTLQAIFERVQRLDALIGSALEDVPVPAGLADAILAKLAASSQAASSQAASSPAAVEVAAKVAVDVAPRAVSRRRFYFMLASAAALLVGGGVWLCWPQHGPLSVAGLLEASGQWHMDLATAAGWQRLARNQKIEGYQVADAVRAVPWRWRDVSNLVGNDAVAYDLSDAGGRRATLFVIRSDESIAGSTPPVTPNSSTGGLMVGCWQSGGLVYVLVVEGDERRYQDLLDRSGAQPLA